MTPTPIAHHPKVKMPLIHEAQVESKPNSIEEDQRKDRVRVKNRRKIYLDRHPEYFTSPDRELSGAAEYTQLTKDKLT
jgi:hypothetical protein